MFRKFFFAALTGTILGPVAAGAQSTVDGCGVAGPNAYFCFGDTFRELKLKQVEGVSFWMHEGGYLSKVLVEETGGKAVTSSQVETRILAMVTEQAHDLGRDFNFSDLRSANVHGVPFGTFSYRLEGAAQDSAVLHSYVVVKERILQVVSQVALNSASRDPADLQEAHAAALRAVKIVDRGSDA